MTVISLPLSAQADQRLNGTWESTRNNLILTIESTGNGIRVKRSDQNRWYQYEEYRDGQYRDQQGNNYYMIDNSTLEWEDHSGRKYLRFQRRNQQNEFNRESQVSGHSDSRYRYDDSKNDTHIERNHHFGRNARNPFVSTHQLTGNWINRTTGQMISVKARSNGLRVKAHRASWSNFVRRDGNTFIDQRGNRYDFQGGRLTYHSRNQDFLMEFQRL
jgi:hypothetical protein